MRFESGPVAAACSTVLGYAVARRCAISIAKQEDVVAKLPSEHWDDIKVAVGLGLGVWALGGTNWLTWATVPVATGVYAVVSDAPALRASLNRPTPALKTALGIVGGVLAVAAWYLWTTSDAATLTSGGVVLGVAGCLIASDYVAHVLSKRVDGFHVHHWMLGLGLAAALARFPQAPAGVATGIALGVFVHGCSVYRPTSAFCSWRVPCRMTRYGDVPRVAVN